MALWESKLIKELTTIITLNVDRLSKVVYTLNEESQQKWIDTLKEEINETCTLLVEEASFFVAVQYLRKNCSKLCELLQIEMHSYDSEKLTLYEEKKLLERLLKEYEEEVTNRQEQFQEMTIRQVELCRFLERVPLTFVEKSVPSELELKRLLSDIEKLEKELEVIKNKFHRTKLDIMAMIATLKIEISSEIQQIIVSVDQLSQPVTREILRSVTYYYSELKRQQNKEEYQQLESLQNIIDELYDSCHIAKGQRNICQNIHQYHLDFIQNEISELKNYWEQNKEIFSLFENYNQHWMSLSNLMQTNKNQMLDKKVTEAKILCWHICRFEKRLINAAVQFERENNRPFTTFDQTIPEIIAGLHDTFGKHTLPTKGNIEKSVSSIIHDKRENMTADKSIASQHLEFEDSENEEDPMIKRELLEITPSIEEGTDELCLSGPPTLVNEKLASQSSNVPAIDSAMPNLLEENLPIYNPTANTEGNINVNINNQETPVQVNIFVNTPTPSNTTLRIQKSNPYNICKNGKKYYNRQKLKQNQSSVKPGAIAGSPFKPKAVEMIRDIFKDLDLK